MNLDLSDRLCGVAVGAAVGDALGMPLEFGQPHSPGQRVREMLPGRLPAGTFTDDTEMALALAESLLAHHPLNPADLAQRFVAWLKGNPPDVGIHTASVLRRVAQGEAWDAAAATVQAQHPASAGNGSVMRCWPVTLARWSEPPATQLERLIADSMLQSRVTHPHPECNAGSAFINVTLYYLLHGFDPEKAVTRALELVEMPDPLSVVIKSAPGKNHGDLPNTGWVRHTVESVIWGLLTTSTFEDAVVNVVNLGNDADTAGTVAGALAGAAYGLSGIPARWCDAVQGEFPLGSGRRWRADDLANLAQLLAA